VACAVAATASIGPALQRLIKSIGFPNSLYICNMEFKLGDKVAALDLDLEGIVKKVSTHDVLVETADGFEILFNKKEVIKYQKTSSLSNLKSSFNLNEIKRQKETSQKPKTPSVKRAKGSVPPPEIDLHIEKLVKNYHRMSSFEILNFQIETAKYRLETALKNKTQRLIFIHGIGDGVLKAELDHLFSKYNLICSDADYRKYGVGATEVCFKQKFM
jgi:hypothetical protein